MLTKVVILKYHAFVSFPWTAAKIKKEGFNPTTLLLKMGRDLEKCEDKDTPTAKAVLDLLEDLRMLP